MNITQRKIIHGYTRAFASDHKRGKEDSDDVENLFLLGMVAVVIIGAVLKVCGVL